jgi:hypothetical protein
MRLLLHFRLSLLSHEARDPGPGACHLVQTGTTPAATPLVDEDGLPAWTAEEMKPECVRNASRTLVIAECASWLRTGSTVFGDYANASQVRARGADTRAVLGVLGFNDRNGRPDKLPTVPLPKPRALGNSSLADATACPFWCDQVRVDIANKKSPTHDYAQITVQGTSSEFALWVRLDKYLRFAERVPNHRGNLNVAFV